MLHHVMLQQQDLADYPSLHKVYYYAVIISASYSTHIYASVVYVIRGKSLIQYVLANIVEPRFTGPPDLLSAPI